MTYPGIIVFAGQGNKEFLEIHTGGPSKNRGKGFANKKKQVRRITMSVNFNLISASLSDEDHVLTDLGTGRNGIMFVIQLGGCNVKQ